MSIRPAPRGGRRKRPIPASANRCGRGGRASAVVVRVADLLQPVDRLPSCGSWIANGSSRSSRVAPCQCFSPGGNQTTSPGRMFSTGPPQRCTRPRPAVTIRVWPSGWVCQAVRAPGSKVTLAPCTRAGSRRVEQRVDADGAGEIGGGTSRRGLRARAPDVHGGMLQVGGGPGPCGSAKPKPGPAPFD